MIATWVLAVAVIILLIMLWGDWNSSHNLGTVLNNGQNDITTVRDRVQADCRGPDANEARCQESLSELADILREFSANLSTATTTSP